MTRDKEYNEDDEIAVCYVTPYDADALHMAVKTIEQEPCEDAVSRANLLKQFEDRFIELQKAHRKDLQFGINWCINTLLDAPAVIPVKTGQWVFIDKAHEHAYCSECGYGNVDLFNGRPHNYCPNCGAKMEEEENE